MAIFNGYSGSQGQSNEYVRSGINVLDNWYFLNPVNQRRVTGEITDIGYFIDRWKLTSGTVTVGNSGLILNGTMVQILEFPLSANVVASALTTTGAIPATYDNSSKTFSITATGETIIAAKLEIGNVSTIAQPNGDLNDPPPNFQQELAKCQRFFYRAYASASYSAVCVANAYTTKRFEGVFYLPTTLRAKPKFNYSGSFSVYYGPSKNVSISSLSAIQYGNMGLASFFMEIHVSDDVTAGIAGLLEGMSNSYLEFDADL